MEAAQILRFARTSAGLSQRTLAERAGTSHATLCAYETGKVDPSVSTFNRILRAAGFRGEVDLVSYPREVQGYDRGDELAQVLELASQFPTRSFPRLTSPVFGHQ
jgi:transcriptional regulator with XRE-family HTH domain